MGRNKIDENKLKINTKIRIRKDLKEEAKRRGINFSELMENVLKEILKID